ncbi:hypothetical protein VTI74DRAFT_8840 [Chaetomium olivicolor]
MSLRVNNPWHPPIASHSPDEGGAVEGEKIPRHGELAPAWAREREQAELQSGRREPSCCPTEHPGTGFLVSKHAESSPAAEEDADWGITSRCFSSSDPVPNRTVWSSPPSTWSQNQQRIALTENTHLKEQQDNKEEQTPDNPFPGNFGVAAACPRRLSSLTGTPGPATPIPAEHNCPKLQLMCGEVRGEQAKDETSTHFLRLGGGEPLRLFRVN